MAPQAGDVVAGYRLEELIGVGGSDCPVFRATHLRLHREVALKLLPRELASDDFVRRFEREAQLAASLQDHPNIVAIYDFGDTDEVLYLAMRLVRGTDLEQLVSAGPLSVARTCVILGQVAEALDAAHAAGLVHRDVKPGNIFVDPGDGQGTGDRAYVGDFGLMLRRDVSSATRALWYGSPRYLAPERWAGALPHPSVDVYALGCVAYACLSGHPPFTGDSDERLRFEHAQAPPPLLSAGLAEVPLAVDEVLSKAIAKQPGDRYGSCREFVAALRAVAVMPGAETLSGPLVPRNAPTVGTPHRAVSSGEPGPAEDDHPSVPEGRRHSRRVVLVATAGAIGVAVVASLGAALNGTETVDGNATALSGPAPGSSEAALGPDLNALAVDGHGNLYLVFRRLHTVKKLTADGTLSTVAGGNGKGSSGDGGPATKAKLNYPHGLTVGLDGDLLIADTGNGRIRRVDAKGVINTVAGTGESEASGDNGPATEADLDGPTGVAVGPRGDIYIVESNGNRVRRVDDAGRITTVAGTGTAGSAGDGGPATRAEFSYPVALAVHGAEIAEIYVSDAGNDRIRHIDSRGVVTTVAGSGSEEGGDDGDVATSVALQGADNIAVGRDGSLYLAERFGDRVRRVGRDGRVTTVAGTGVPGFSGDGGPGAKAQVAGPTAVAVSPDGAVYVGDTMNRRVRRVEATGVIATVVGSGPVYPGDGRKATEASLLEPRMARQGPDGRVYIADAGNNRVRRIELDGSMVTMAGAGVKGYGGDGGDAKDAKLDYPTGIDFGADGTLYIADANNNRIRAVGRDGVITTVAGIGRGGSAGDGGPAEQAELTDPQSVEVAQDGSLYVAERAGNRIRRIGPDRIISTVAGTGGAGFSGDGGPATSARLDGPTGVHVGTDGTVYISDYRNARLRRVDVTGTITTVAGTGTRGYNGDGGPATTAELTGPFTVVLGTDRNLYIADDDAYTVRQIDTSGVITAVAGNGDRGQPTDGDPASTTNLAKPAGISITTDGTLLVTDVGNQQVYSIGADGVLHVLAGET